MGRPTKKEVRYRDSGRPTVMTQELINKLEEGFSMGYTDREACFYAGITPPTLYKFQEKNPDFVNRKEDLKNSPVLMAKKTIVSNLNTVNTASWYLEKKDPAFKNVTKTEVEAKVQIQDVSVSEGIKEALEVYNKARKAQIIEAIRKAV